MQCGKMERIEESVEGLKVSLVFPEVSNNTV